MTHGHGLIVAVFVTPHGFGHASRISAVLNAILKSTSVTQILLFGKTPSWFWENNFPVKTNYVCFTETTDVGLIQKSPFKHDLKKTITHLHTFFENENSRVNHIVDQLYQHGVNLVLSDISSLGLKVGNKLGVPTVLVENFTWSWIYQKLTDENPYFEEVIQRLEQSYKLADLRIQCTPFCEFSDSAKQVCPVFRPPFQNPVSIKEQLGFLPDEHFFLLTTGGIVQSFNEESLLNSKVNLVIPVNRSSLHRVGNLIYLPMNSKIPFPDLVYAATAVIGKAGYGTIAEAWGMQKPFFGVYRKNFRESSVLRDFAEKELIHREIEENQLKDLAWLKGMDFKKSVSPARKNNGASEIAQQILQMLPAC